MEINSVNLLPGRLNQAARQVVVDGLKDYLRGPHQRSSSGDVVEAEQIHAGSVRQTPGGSSSNDIDQRPEDFYHVGVLWPAEEPIDGEDDDQFVDDVDPASGTSADSPIALSNAMRQAAMGLSLLVEPALQKIEATVSWGLYTLEQGEEVAHASGELVDGAPQAEAVQPIAEIPLLWRRRPRNFTVEIDLPRLDLEQPQIIKAREETDGLEFTALFRETAKGRFLTLTLVNRRPRHRGGGAVDALESPCIFQSEIRVASVGKGGFLSSTNTGLRKTSDKEYWSHELLYRDCRQFGLGHGVSVNWQVSQSGRTSDSVWTEWLPDVEIRKADPDSLDDRSPLDLDLFAKQEGASSEELLQVLRSLPEEYSTWIMLQRELTDPRCEGFPEAAREPIWGAAQANLDSCEKQNNRILEGIAFLEEDPNAMTAFRLMSRAMRKTMAGDRPAWRPFQLAFILLAIPSAAMRDHVDRELFDLIWFPTGGGKTEAYLGLTAFVLFYRYLTNPPQLAGGTAVLTRYTLRLLTTQQFERSAKTIVACEFVRREEPRFQEYPPFTIGILVGQASTPNRLQEAKKAASPRRGVGDDGGDESTLVPIEGCPWCKTVLQPFEPFVQVDIERQSITTRCPNEECDFHSGIPIVVVDEAIYASPPSFVIATIDKLAQLSTEPRMARILGSGTGGLPPDLIIQDELHLINDALGTVAALFEMAVEFLATDEQGRAPKLIGSTATIRQADYQIRRLYDRPVTQFPPNGITIDDSFFYRTDRQRPGRTYLGIHAQGRAAKTTLPIILGLLAQLPQRIGDKNLRDPFFTNVAYFNSLRELGGALVLAEDDANRYLENQFVDDPSAVGKREIIQIKELTSRLSFRDIKKMFKQMEIDIVESTADSEPLDLVLASSMLSVGVDIDRLGLMLVNGQPKTTSEYIQATSRVGRAESSAGLVVTFFNWSRPRDRSHYERFVGYHESFYRYVEAVSVTPFSARARERALRGAVAAMIRGSALFRENELDPQAVISIAHEGTEAFRHIDAVRQALERRVRSFAPEEADETLIDFSDFCSWMIRRAETSEKSGSSFLWRKPDKEVPGSPVCLLRRGARNDGNEFDLVEAVVPLSMRDVDIQAPVVSLRYLR
jgi:hypothetical protein